VQVYHHCLDRVRSLSDCIFCRIVRKESESSTIYEDEKVLALMDIKPFKSGHVLVIPKGHFENIYDIPEDVIAQLYIIVKRIAIVIKKSIKPEGISIIQSNEIAGSQGIFHFHTHVIPRYYGDRINQVGVIWESDRMLTKKELEPVAEKIRKNMKD